MIKFSSFSRFVDKLEKKGYRESFPPGCFDSPETRHLNYAWNFTKGNVLVMVYSEYAIIKPLRQIKNNSLANCL